MRTISTLTIDLCRHETPQRIRVMQADANTRCVSMRLLADGDVWPIPEGITASMGYCKPDGTGGLYDKLPDGSDAMSIEGNCITVVLAPQVLTAHGVVRAVITLTDADMHQLSTFPFEILVQKNPVSENIVSENYCYYTNLDAINRAIGDVSGLKIGIDLVSAINALMDDSDMEFAEIKKMVEAEIKAANIPTKLSHLPNDAGFITKAVRDLEHYYRKTETYSREEIDQRVGAIPKFSIQVVSSLPTSGISGSAIYLVPGRDSSDLYTEYIYINGKWEILGSQRMDLTEYATEEWVRNHYQPKGDYLTTDNKREIVDAVISALPAWEGGSY